MTRPLDLATVPDFLGTKSHIQEGQTLFFLASWIDNAGQGRRFPLHLACIGEPPSSVRYLAEQAGAQVTVHAPVSLRAGHHVGNKLRGFEVAAQTDRLFLVDVDTLVLSDLGPLAELTDCLAAAPDDCPRVSEALWRTIYPALGLPWPQERTACIAAELGLPRFPGRLQGFRVPRRELGQMLPYHNGGAVLAPWACGLRQLWEENYHRIAALFDERQGPLGNIHTSDQASLAVSIEMLKARGWGFRRLPDRFNVRWRHLFAGAVPVDEIAVLHATRFLHALPPGPLTLENLRAAARYYFEIKLRRRFSRLLAGELLRVNLIGGLWRYGEGRQVCRQLHRRVEQLCDRYVRPALEASAPRRHAGRRLTSAA